MFEIVQIRRTYQICKKIGYYLYGDLTGVERRLLFGFLLIALLALGGLSQERWLAVSTPIPSEGGVYREGILTNTGRMADDPTLPLTHIGLLRVDSNHVLQPGLATAWTISDDAQSFRLTLDERVSPQTVLETLAAQSGTGYWENATVTNPEGQILEFQITKPWAGFLYELASQIFPFGPYVVTEQTDNSYFLATNPKALNRPFIPRIELQLYTEERALERAIRKNLVDGAFFSYGTDLQPSKNWERSRRFLRPEYLLFFNLRREVIDNQTVRDRLIRGEALASPVNLRLVTADSSTMHDLANQIQADGQKLGAEISVETYPLLTLTKKILPEHDYDLALVGLDYGADGDLYPYWHSLQIVTPGQNIAGYRNKDVDKLLDETRLLKEFSIRAEKFQQVRALLDKDAIVKSYGSPEITYLRSPAIHGTIPASFATPTDRWAEIQTWYTKEKRIAKGSE